MNVAALPFDIDLPQPRRAQLELLWRDGFVRMTGLLAPGDVAALQEECARLMRELARMPWTERAGYGQDYRVPIFADDQWSVLSNLIGRSAAADAVLERLFTHSDLVVLLDAALGRGYKICQLGIRRCEGADAGLRMHQDSGGEFGMSVLLGDVLEEGGTTAFLPGSHRYPLRSTDAGMPYIHPKYFRHLATPARGRAGDVVLFFNKTWHGRLPASRPVSHDAILLNLFGPGYEYRPFEAPAEVLAAAPPELRRLIDPVQGLERLPSGRSRVLRNGPAKPALIDFAYGEPPTRVHPAQLLRVLVPVFRAALPVKRWASRLLR